MTEPTGSCLSAAVKDFLVVVVEDMVRMTLCRPRTVRTDEGDNLVEAQLIQTSTLLKLAR
jgi:hypothetical protein